MAGKFMLKVYFVDSDLMKGTDDLQTEKTTIHGIPPTT